MKPHDVGVLPETAGGYKGISLVTHDMASTYKELSAQGVKFTQPPEQMPWGQMAT